MFVHLGNYLILYLTYLVPFHGFGPDVVTDFVLFLSTCFALLFMTWLISRLVERTSGR